MMMSQSRMVRGLVACLVLGFGAHSLAGEVDTLVVPDKVLFAKNLIVRGKTKTECRLEERVADDIKRNVGRVYTNVVSEKPKSGKYHVLEVEIVDVFGAGGGGWSGPKHLELQGRLLDKGGKIVGSFRGRRTSAAGFTALKGTCSMLHKCSKTLGKDLAVWLQDPKPNSYLGNE